MNQPDLIIALQQGDNEAFKKLIDEWQDMVYNTALGIIQNEDDADEITQEVFIQVFQSIRSFKGDAKISTWLYRITISKALDYLKKQQRKDYPEKYVIYILTTEDNKKKRIYIVGKASKLKNRLSNYNKTSEHEVVYYKSCKSEEDMNVIELMVINKLKEYKEKANRDRFILPIEKDITFFTDIIDKSINFF